MHSLLRSIAGSPSLSSSSPNFPNCSSPRESASVYAAYLRSHLSVSQPKALRSRARGYLTELHQATCPVESHLSFCSSFSPTEFHAVASNLLPSAALFMLTIWTFGPPHPRSPLQGRPHKELCFDWSAGLSTGVFLSIQANVRPPSQWIPTKPTSSPTSYLAPTSVSIQLQLFLRSPSTAFFPFVSMYLR